MNKTIALIGAALVCFISTFAASISHTASIFPQLTNWSFTNSIPQFDTSLGTLTNVSITISVNVVSRLRVENRDRAPWLTYAASEVTATSTVAGYPAVATLTNSYTTTLLSFDGSLDYGGTSGFDVTLVGSNSATSIPSDFTPFLGTGVVPLTASASAIGFYDGPGYARFIVNTTASAIVVITYEFSPPSCPECPPVPICTQDDKDDYRPRIKANKDESRPSRNRK